MTIDAQQKCVNLRYAITFYLKSAKETFYI